MPKTQSISVVKWSPYNIGEIQTLIMREINQLVAKKEYRRKIGLEKGVYSEFKGNTHWNLFISIKISEALVKRMNEDMRSIFIQNAHGFNSTSTQINNLNQELKKVEFNINSATTLASNNTIKSVRAEMANIKKISAQLTKINNELESRTSSLHEQIETLSNQFNDKLTEGLQSVQKSILDDVNNLKEASFEKFNELSKSTLENVNNLKENNTERFNELSSQFNENIANVKNELNNVQERLVNFQEANNNMLDDQTKSLIAEFQEGVGGLLKQNLDNVENLVKNSDDMKNLVVTKVDESKDDLKSVLEATNEHIENINHNINENIKQTELQFNKELKTEVSDIRGILSAIRSDIELMKSVLTKLDTKIH